MAKSPRFKSKNSALRAVRNLAQLAEDRIASLETQFGTGSPQRREQILAGRRGLNHLVRSYYGPKRPSKAKVG